MNPSGTYANFSEAATVPVPVGIPDQPFGFKVEPQRLPELDLPRLTKLEYTIGDKVTISAFNSMFLYISISVGMVLVLFGCIYFAGVLYSYRKSLEKDGESTKFATTVWMLTCATIVVIIGMLSWFIAKIIADVSTKRKLNAHFTKIRGMGENNYAMERQTFISTMDNANALVEKIKTDLENFEIYKTNYREQTDENEMQKLKTVMVNLYNTLTNDYRNLGGYLRYFQTFRTAGGGLDKEVYAIREMFYQLNSILARERQFLSERNATNLKTLRKRNLRYME